MADSEHNVKIKVNGDAKSAVQSFAVLRGSIEKVGTVLRGAFSFVSKINWVVSGIQTIIEGFKKLNEWIHRAEIAAKALREEIANQTFKTAIDNANAAYEKLIKNIKLANDLEHERNAILEKRKTTSRDLEDAEIERNKQIELSELDPTSDDYDAKRSEIDRKYAREASRLSVKRADEDNRRETESLYEQAAEKDREAAKLRRQYRSATAIEEKARERSHKAEMEARGNGMFRGGSEESVKRAEEAEEQWKKAFDFAKNIKDQMEAAEREAQNIRNRAGEMLGGSMSARIRDEAVQMRLDNEAKEYAGKQEKAAAEKQAAEQAAADKRAAEIARREAERAEQEKMRGMESQFRDAQGARDRSYSVGQVSQNRLTALGLGSGVSGSDSVATEMNKIIDLLQQQITATKANKPEPNDTMPTYSE